MIDISVEDIVKKAIAKGCDSAEVYLRNSSGISVEAKGGKVEALEASRDFGLALKVIKGKKLGFSFTTTPDGIGRTIDEAVEGSAWTGDDEYIGIPDCLKPQDVLVFDPAIKNIDEKDVINEALLLESTALSFDERIKKVRKAEVSAGSGTTTIANSNGINITYDSTYYSAHVTTLGSDNGDSQMGWEYAGSRRRSDIDIKAVGEGSAKRALELLGSKKMSAVKVPVILTPSVAIEFLEILSSSISAEAVQKQRSFLAGKTGQTIISPLIDLVDDGTRQWGTGTSPVDGEGVPSKNKIIVEKGVLKGYIHNTYTARKDGVSSTGNAARGSAKGLPGVGVTNFYISTMGDSSEQGLITSMKKGIVVLSAMGVHTANPVSGDFSVGISGLWVENGEIQYPIKEAIVSGNILEMFKKVEAVGDNLTFYGSAGSPSLLVGDMDISA